MASTPLTWAQAMGRMAAVGYRTARGSVRYRLPDRDGRPTGTYRFWHAPPGRWRVEDESGLVNVQDGRQRVVRDDAGTMQRLDQQGSSYSFGIGHPASLLGDESDRVERFCRADDFSVPIGDGIPVTVAGRPCWEFALAPPPRKSHPLRVTVDDATGAVLRLAVPEAGMVVEAERFEVDVEIPAETFAWDGPADATWADERRRGVAAQEWLGRQLLPVPRYWPRGIHYHAIGGDPATGAFLVMLEVAGDPLLARWPHEGAPPEQWDTHSKGRHIHQWADRAWRWAIAVEERLSEEDLRRVVDSMTDGERGRG